MIAGTKSLSSPLSPLSTSLTSITTTTTTTTDYDDEQQQQSAFLPPLTYMARTPVMMMLWKKKLRKTFSRRRRRQKQQPQQQQKQKQQQQQPRTRNKGKHAANAVVAKELKADRKSFRRSSRSKLLSDWVAPADWNQYFSDDENEEEENKVEDNDILEPVSEPTIRGIPPTKRIQWIGDDTPPQILFVDRISSDLRDDLWYTEEEIKMFALEKYMEDHPDEFELVESDDDDDDDDDEYTYASWSSCSYIEEEITDDEYEYEYEYELQCP